MKKPLGLIILLASAFGPSASAQNVSGYAMIPEPFLFLLREPSVHEDLGLDAEQKKTLVTINESFDETLLSTRNMRPKEAQEKAIDVLKKSREQVTRLFTVQQQERMRQITYWLRGLSFVLLPDAAEQLNLTDQQKEKIAQIVASTLEEISNAQSPTYQGAEAHRKSQQIITAARKKEQADILLVLSDQQEQKLISLIGRRFDPNSLGRVSFKAPELADGDEWINSEPLKLRNLRGKVVALHFYAFG